MTELVDLEDLNLLRFPRSPRNPKTLQRLARNGDLPGARMIGGRWFVDLEKFDAPATSMPTALAFEPIEVTRARVRMLVEQGRR
ncbi:hypothetical protein [Dokdonella ginsengisoli]|uniref:Uncharacterized protein n=1 Tax=Dokdonella ginsengisoli TaxID=363846 RepID=A0ABV9QQM8_9GAMM